MPPKIAEPTQSSMEDLKNDTASEGNINFKPPHPLSSQLQEITAILNQIANSTSEIAEMRRGIERLEKVLLQPSAAPGYGHVNPEDDAGHGDPDTPFDPVTPKNKMRVGDIFKRPSWLDPISPSPAAAGAPAANDMFFVDTRGRRTRGSRAAAKTDGHAIPDSDDGGLEFSEGEEMAEPEPPKSKLGPDSLAPSPRKTRAKAKVPATKKATAAKQGIPSRLKGKSTAMMVSDEEDDEEEEQEDEEEDPIQSSGTTPATSISMGSSARAPTGKRKNVGGGPETPMPKRARKR